MALLSSKPTNPSPAAGDIGYNLKDPGGTPSDESVANGDLVTKAHGLSDGVVVVSSGVMTPVASTGTGNIVRASAPALTSPTGIVKGDVGLGNVDNTSNATERAASATLTNKTIGGASNTLTVRAASDITGQLPLANGGTAGTSKATGFDNLQPMTTAGDIIYGGASGTGTRLALGTSNQMLQGGATAPAWQTLDGWIDASYTPTWTRVSNSQFTISSATNYATVLQPGTYLKVTDTTTKYFVVATSSFSASTTTVNLVSSTDYVLVASPTVMWYSYDMSPQGWPGWFNYAPTVTGWGGSPAATNVYRWSSHGRTMRVYIIAYQATQSGTVVQFTTPVGSANITNESWGAPQWFVVVNNVRQTAPGLFNLTANNTVINAYLSLTAGTAWTTATTTGIGGTVLEYQF